MLLYTQDSIHDHPYYLSLFKNHLIQNVNIGEVEKPWPTLRIGQTGDQLAIILSMLLIQGNSHSSWTTVNPSETVDPPSFVEADDVKLR